MPGSVIISGARTPIGKLSGAFASLSATDLGAAAVAAELEGRGSGPTRSTMCTWARYSRRARAS